MLICKSFRVENGKAVMTTDTYTKDMRINIDYYSKDTLLATHSSFIIAKESPLLVSKN